MEATAQGKERGAVVKSPFRSLPTLSQQGPLGRHRVSIRISVEGHKIGFAGTVLEGGWVTAEVSEELPHNHDGASLNEAAVACREIALEGLNQALDVLLVSVTTPVDVGPIQRLLDNSAPALALGLGEAWVRAFRAAPERVWRSLSQKEQEQLRA